MFILLFHASAMCYDLMLTMLIFVVVVGLQANYFDCLRSLFHWVAGIYFYPGPRIPYSSVRDWRSTWVSD